jgi:hypothetical protein
MIRSFRGLRGIVSTKSNQLNHENTEFHKNNSERSSDKRREKRSDDASFYRTFLVIQVRQPLLFISIDTPIRSQIIIVQKM